MKRNGGSLKAKGGLWRSGSAMIGRNPVAIGGSTAFAVVFAFISANALWYQPHAHPGPFFKTRQIEFIPGPVQEVKLHPAPSEPSPQRRPQRTDAISELADPTVLKVQEILADLRLYDAVADGLRGPQTREAIMEYQRVVGLEQTGSIDAELLRHLGLRQASAPVPAPRPDVQTASLQSNGKGDSVILRIQTALKAFGNENMEIDGIAGKQTETAVREFQALFGLEVNGRPDEALLRKMQELGLVE